MEELTGHSSAASLPTGPVMAEPFISPLGLTICGHVSYCVVLYFGGAQDLSSFPPESIPSWRFVEKSHVSRLENPQVSRAASEAG